MTCPLITISKATEMINWVLIDVSLVCYVKILLIFVFRQRGARSWVTKCLLKKKKAHCSFFHTTVCFIYLFIYLFFLFLPITTPSKTHATSTTVFSMQWWSNARVIQSMGHQQDTSDLMLCLWRNVQCKCMNNMNLFEECPKTPRKKID